jgi:hypothetical protein
LDSQADESHPLAKNHPAIDWLVEMRRKIANLAPMPSR